MNSHVHSAALTGLIILAWMIVWGFLLKGFAAHHASNPAAQGLVPVLA